jgi:phosphate/sulfate permease
LDVKTAEADTFLALWGGLGISLGLIFYGERVIQYVPFSYGKFQFNFKSAMEYVFEIL